MGWFQIISILVALAGYFMSKKSGANDTEAALVGAAAGVGTYYVGTQTEWGKDIVNGFDGETDLVKATAPDGTEIKDESGSTVMIPAGSTVVTDANGKVVTESGSPVIKIQKEDGSFLTTTVSKMAEVLKSWGPTGTAAVVGTTAIATGSDKKTWIYLGLGALALLLIERS